MTLGHDDRCYIQQKLSHGLGRIWADVQQKVKVYLLSIDLCHFKYDEFIQVLDIVNRCVLYFFVERRTLNRGRTGSNPLPSPSLGNFVMHNASVHLAAKWDWRWPSLCRLDLERTGSVGEPLTNCARVGHAKTVMRRWGYLDDAQSVDCDCGEPQTMAHLLSCRLLDEACTADDMATVAERAKACARKWEKIV